MPTEVHCTSETVSQLRLYAQQLLTLADLYKDIVDSYVVEFFVKRRWDLIPKSWQEALSGLPPQELAELLLGDKSQSRCRRPLPLSLLAYLAATRSLALDPTPKDGDVGVSGDPSQKPIELLCRLHIKAKKRHEILRLAKAINSASELTNTRRVVDVGSGQGHLSRLLSFGFGQKVTSIEAVGCHLTGAAKVDTKIKTIMQKRMAKQSNRSEDQAPPTPPQHVECRVHPQIKVEEFLSVINSQSHCTDEYLDPPKEGETDRPLEGQSKHVPHTHSNDPYMEATYCEDSKVHQRKRITDDFQNHMQIETEKTADGIPNKQAEDLQFVLAGLHTCGDLAPTMLRVFARCDQARALVSVACCYMRMECAIPPTDDHVTEKETLSEQEKICFESPSRKRSCSPPTFESCAADKSALSYHRHIHDASFSLKSGDWADGEREGSDWTEKMKGYPMSSWVQSLGGKGIQFEALELACHSVQNYYHRLKDQKPHLILHGYRATLEVLIQEFDRELTQNSAGICRIKKAVASIRKPHLKTFQEYASSALTGLGIPFTESGLAELEEKLCPEWTNIIIFHVLRILMGPVIESLILVDRVLFLYEQGIESRLVPVFDASISPRNFALVALKLSEQRII